MIFLIIFAILFDITVCAEVPEDFMYDECAPSKDACEYHFTVQEKLTMMDGSTFLSAKGGKLYKYNEDYLNATTNISIDNVVTVDGVPRMVIAINGRVPGPPIVVYEGQKLTIHLKNNLLSDSVTIHWHGLHQKKTPHMDGVGYISQCPIGAGQTFTYKFKAKPKGTFWYHSHVGGQRTNGVFGALIIKENKTKSDADPTDVIMTVGDWHHESSEEVYWKMVYGILTGKEEYKTTYTQDGGMFSRVKWTSGLIEGKGRYLNNQTGELIEAPITWYNVKKNRKYRFRVINVGSIYPFRVSVDEHNITVIASDGYDLKSQLVESFVINPGERFDFLLETNQPVKNYWIRANSMEADVQHHTVKAVLHYPGASEKNEPTTERRRCTKNNPCYVVNCPFSYYPKDEFTNCILLSQMENDVEDSPPAYTKDSEEHFFNFAFPGEKGQAQPGSVNGRKFLFPGVNSLTQGDEIGDFNCRKKDCGIDKLCDCHYEQQIPFNKTIQMVWLNKGAGAGWAHPIHLHGHSFYVLKMGYPPQNLKTGKLLLDSNNDFIENDDIYCGGGKNYCNNATWKNVSWYDGNVPGLNLKNPPRKDTIIIPTGGYVVLRIRSDNPGKWFMHCHIEVHALDGMAMVLNEALDKVPKAPKGFPICQNFYNDHSRDISYVEETEMQEKCESKTGLHIGIGVIVGVVGTGFVIGIVVGVVFCLKKSK